MNSKITSCKVRMYTMGTGDCFVLSFQNSDEQTQYKLMIDCGVQQISGKNIKKYIDDLIDHVDGEVDALLITHEHNDHVLGFQRAEKIIRDKLKVKELWLPWTEDEGDALVKDWKERYGQKKKSLAIASSMLKEKSETPLFGNIYRTRSEKDESKDVSFKTRLGIANSLTELSDLNTDALGAAGEYTAGLKGMRIAKSLTDKKRILQTGTILENLNGLENIRIYILGPPKNWDNVKDEHGKDGETYKHNNELNIVNGFSCLPFESENTEAPFAESHIDAFRQSDKMQREYFKEENSFRRIDFDWLHSAANLSLRLTRAINNLSAVLAIEFIESEKVMLFPGDAEIGSWKSWHEIAWKEKGEGCEPLLTKDLLNRTVFYKVAHHLSHNGTAKEQGMDHMNHKDLVAMATLDYNVIQSNWKSTMPNRGLVKDLLNKTKGRLLISNLEELTYDKEETRTLEKEIESRIEGMSEKERNQFIANLESEDLFIQFTVNGKK